MYALYGLQAGDFTGAYQSWLNGLHPDDRKKSNQILMQGVRGEREYETEFRVVWPNGSIRTLKAHGHVLRDQGGQPLRMIGVNYDITGRLESVEALRLSEERFSHAFEYAPNGMVLIAADNKVITANRILCELIGYSLEELNGKTFQEVTHPDDIEAELKLIDETLAEDIHFYELEKRYIHKNGSHVWVHLNASLVRDLDGKPLYFIKQIQNISEIKRASEQISEQAALIDEATDGIIARNLEHKIVFWSKGAERMYGWLAEEAQGHHLKELLKADSAKFLEAERSVRETGAWNGEIQKQTKSGAALSINSRWTLLRDSKGQPRSILTIDTDITERKKLELQFLRAQRMESIGTLAGGIAHDLNNILSPIMISIDLLKMMVDKPQATEILNSIEVSTKRGSDIVRQVLSFARGMDGERIEVQPKHLVKDLERILNDTFPKNIRWQFNVPNNIWMIQADPTQIQQVLINLCVNARDAMPHGGLLSIAVENRPLDEQYAAMNLDAKPGPYVAISVSDTGTGIPKEILSKIFDPFFTTKEMGKGTGLGLSTVQGIVKSHRGLINVYSEPGKGTNFKVYLPALTSGTVAPERAQDDELPRGNGETILLVDDEAPVLAMTSRTLQAFGYRVLPARHGAEALAIYAQKRGEIAAVITDMMMPVMDGPATINALQTMNSKVKIIAASGLGSYGSLAKISGTGVKYFLTKPHTAGTLLQTLKKLLQETS